MWVLLVWNHERNANKLFKFSTVLSCRVLRIHCLSNSPMVDQRRKTLLRIKMIQIHGPGVKSLRYVSPIVTNTIAQFRRLRFFLSLRFISDNAHSSQLIHSQTMQGIPVAYDTALPQNGVNMNVGTPLSVPYTRFGAQPVGSYAMPGSQWVSGYMMAQPMAQVDDQVRHSPVLCVFFVISTRKIKWISTPMFVFGFWYFLCFNFNFLITFTRDVVSSHFPYIAYADEMKNNKIDTICVLYALCSPWCQL